MKSIERIIALSFLAVFFLFIQPFSAGAQTEREKTALVAEARSIDAYIPGLLLKLQRYPNDDYRRYLETRIKAEQAIAKRILVAGSGMSNALYTQFRREFHELSLAPAPQGNADNNSSTLSDIVAACKGSNDLSKCIEDACSSSPSGCL